MEDIIFNVMPGKQGNLGVITLNRPRVLNSLNHAMIIALRDQLKQWQQNKEIKGVVIGAADGRAFCAGGDIRSTYEQMLKMDKSVFTFFQDEYQLNRLIYHFPKPYIALLNGITMGGGAGISQHGSHVVGTENLIFAMPETTIGFYPDVGGTYFLSRLRNKIGFYLGLTGNKINGDCALHFGLIHHKVQACDLENLLDRLAQTPFDNHPKATVSTILNEFSASHDVPELSEKQAFINQCFSLQSMEEIIEALRGESFGKDILTILETKSPTSLKVTLEALNNALKLDFDECMNQEEILTKHFVLGHDFKEGIRALIIDKDQKPKWQPATLKDATKDYILSYFSQIKNQKLASNAP